MNANKSLENFIVTRVEEIERDYLQSDSGAKIAARKEELKSALLRLVSADAREKAEDYIDAVCAYSEHFVRYAYKRAADDVTASPDFYKNT